MNFLNRVYFTLTILFSLLVSLGAASAQTVTLTLQTFVLKDSAGNPLTATLVPLSNGSSLIVIPSANGSYGSWTMTPTTPTPTPVPVPDPAPIPVDPPVSRVPSCLILVGSVDHPKMESACDSFFKSKSISTVSLACVDVSDPNIDRGNLSWIAASAGKSLPVAYLSNSDGDLLWTGPPPASVSDCETACAACSDHARSSTASIDVLFSPGGGCERAICNSIAAAKTSILVQAYQLTSNPIALALRDAHLRGVHVELVLDRSQQSSKYSRATFLQNCGISTLFDLKHSIAHNKVILIDNELLIAGSFNFSKSAETENAENLLFIRDDSTFEKFRSNYVSHRSHSVTPSPANQKPSGSCPSGQCPSN